MEKSLSTELNGLFTLDILTPMFSTQGSSTDVTPESDPGTVGSCGSETESQMPW
jgi:hypothetical protein